MLQIKLATRDGNPVAQLSERIEEIAVDRLAHIPYFVDGFVAGTISLF